MTDLPPTPGSGDPYYDDEYMGTGHSAFEVFGPLDDEDDDEPPFNTCSGNHAFGKCDRDGCDFVRLPRG